jgi:GrpB-like predicted nucleotidyltransferase (UPF0157 family)
MNAEPAEPAQRAGPGAAHRRNAGAIDAPMPPAMRIHLVPYDPGWPALFEREAARVRATMHTAALRIEHVGSTSVPGLAAKPVIDILLVESDSADEPAYPPALQAAGYLLRRREPHWYQHRLLRGPDAINVHVVSDGAA